MTNKAIAALLEETADLMEIAGADGFRIRSYRNASAAVESTAESIADIVGDPARDVTKIKGIGKSMAKHLAQIVERGSFERRDELLNRYPPTALEFLKIQGLGPKSIALIYEHFRVSTIDGLEALARDGKLRDLPRMGEKFEQKLIRSIEQYKRGAGRFLLPFADHTAARFIEYLSETEGLDKLQFAGSLRRGKETVGDIDLLATGPNAKEALDRFVAHEDVTDVLGHGDTKASARVGAEGIQIDVRAVPSENYGAAMLYFTGSKEHNVAIRERAVKRGLTLNEYGLKRIDNDETIAAETEEQIYKALDLAWIAPELRENTGEIEAAEKGELPDLITLEDIRCDVHMHTTASDGRFSIVEMAEASKAQGYSHCAITDHTKALAMAGGLDEKRLLAQIGEVKDAAKQVEDFEILSGSEVDILRDGKMDIDDEVLAQLDVVIASVHSYMAMDREEMTDRLLACMENPYVRIMGHPTGRILLRRDPYDYDFEKITNSAAEKGIVMEINAGTDRLDLDAAHIRLALSKGIKFSINTDAHHTRHLENMKYGVLTARRGWLTKDDVVNTKENAGFLGNLRPKP